MVSVIAKAYADAVRTGGVVDLNSATPGRYALGRVQLPPGYVSRWSVIATGYNANPAVNPDHRNKLVAKLGLQGGAMEYIFDYPSRGGVVSLPWSQSIDLSAQVEVPLASASPPLVMAACFAPSTDAGGQPPVYTTTLESIDPASFASFNRPFGAVAYRLWSTETDLATEPITVLQEALTGAVLSVDCSDRLWFSGGPGLPQGTIDGRDVWVPLVPSAERVTIYTSVSTPDPFGYAVMFRLAA